MDLTASDSHKADTVGMNSDSTVKIQPKIAKEPFNVTFVEGAATPDGQAVTMSDLEYSTCNNKTNGDITTEEETATQIKSIQGNKTPVASVSYTTNGAQACHVDPLVIIASKIPGEPPNNTLVDGTVSSAGPAVMMFNQESFRYNSTSDEIIPNIVTTEETNAQQINSIQGNQRTDESTVYTTNGAHDSIANNATQIPRKPPDTKLMIRTSASDDQASMLSDQRFSIQNNTTNGNITPNIVTPDMRTGTQIKSLQENTTAAEHREDVVRITSGVETAYSDPQDKMRPKIPRKPPNCTLVFHAVIASRFCTQPDSVILNFCDNRFEDVVMEHKRPIDCDTMLLEGTARIHLKHSERQRLEKVGLKYRYSMLIRDVNMTVHEEEMPCLAKGKEQEMRKEKIRNLKISRNIGTKDGKKPGKELHQYDGTIQFTNAFVSNLQNSGVNAAPQLIFDITKEKVLLEEANAKAMLAFVPSIHSLTADMDIPVADILERIEHVRLCANDWFVDVESGHGDQDYYIYLYLQREIEQLKMSKCQSISEKSSLIQAVVIVYLFTKYNIQLPHEIKGTNRLLFTSLLLEAKSGTLNEDFQLIRHHFNTDQIQEELCNFLTKYIIQNKNHLLHEWIFALPIITHLSIKTLDWNVLADELLGLESLIAIKEHFESEFRYTPRSLMECIYEMSNLFDKDQLLPKVVMDFLSFEQVAQVAANVYFPPEYLFIKCMLYIRQRRAPNEQFRSVKARIYGWIERLNVTHPDLIDREKLLQLFSIGVHHACELFKQEQVKFEFGHSIKDTIDMLSSLGRTCFEAIYTEQRKNKLNGLWDTLLENILTWLKKNYPLDRPPIERIDIFTTNTLEMVEYLLGVKMPTTELNNTWCNEITSLLEAGLRSLSTEKKMRMYCHLGQVHTKIEQCCKKVATDAIELLSNQCPETLPKWLHKSCLRQDPRAVTLVCSYFKTWFQRHSDKTALEIMLEYSQFMNFWRLLYKPDITLDDDVSKLMIKCKETIGTIIQDLEKGSVTLTSFLYIINKKTDFNLVCEKVYGHQYCGLEENIQDFQEFRARNENIRHIISACDKELVAVKHRSVEDFMSMKISTIWCRTESGLMIIPEYNLSETLWTIIPHIVRRLRITSFARIFSGTCQRLRTNDQLSLQDILRKAWPKTEKDIDTFVRKLLDGSLTLANVETYLGDFRHNIQDLEKEMKAIGVFDGEVCKEVVSERCKQITMFFCSDSLKATANVYLQLRDTLQLTGNFKALIQIMNTGSQKDIPISAISIDLFGDIPVLNLDELRCLETFIDCIDLVRWMKAKLKGPQGIKRLAELAMSSAEDQGDCEVEKVSNLLATVAYGPLMFQLHKSDDYKKLAENCRYVFEALKTDPNLADKMISTKENLNWLESVHESISSIETNTLDKAVHILQHGRFSMGNIQNRDNIKVLDDVLLVNLAKQQKRCKKSIYNLVELKDLNSKLVLIAGPSHEYYEQATTFGEIYDVMTRIGKCYVRLCEIGCILFQNMIIRFNCSNKVGVVQIDMKLKGIEEVKRKSDSWTGVLDILKDVDNNLNACLDKMLAEITKQRKCFSELNYFTTKQLSILRRELVELNRNFFFKPQMDDIYPILHCIKRECAYEDLQMSMKRSRRINPQIPKATWCTTRNPWTENPCIVSDGLPEMPPRTSRSLFEIWALYTTIYDDGMITLEHLGLFLQQLGQMDTGNIQRSITAPFVKGRPNLVVCPQGEMYQMLLSIYMHERGVKPSDDEILLCTQETSDEEVNLLFRRSVGSSTCMGIYCLVNADNLEYSVANTTLQQLDHLTAGVNDYQLVVLCSQENEQKALYVTALDKYRISTSYKQSKENIRKYILNMLREERGGKKEQTPLGYINSERSAVLVLKSNRAGCGKTLRKNRLQIRAQQIHGKKLSTHTIAVNRRSVSSGQIQKALIEATKSKYPALIHIDVAHEVENGLDNLLFNSMILGCLKDENGHVWRRRKRDLILVENVPLLTEETGTNTNPTEGQQSVHQMIELLPSKHCLSPSESQQIMDNNNKSELYDREELQSDVIQRPCWYLDHDRRQVNALAVYKPNKHNIDPARCIDILLRHCGINDPSWAELGYFAKFLNEQLKDCENSVYCSQIIADDLPGFKDFVVSFMIQMSRDFATRSLVIAEETGQDPRDAHTTDTVAGFEMKRKWENSPHPYIFFNKDGTTMTFLGFHINESTLDLIDLHSGVVLEHSIMTRELYNGLTGQGVNMSENMHELQQEEKLDKLRQVLGVSDLGVDDNSYELTLDNVKKILAIDMRFRCGIPVVIMGETGCGKTRLVEYMCNIKKPRGIRAQNMIILKVHGGTTEKDIIRTVNQALQAAQRNKTKYDLDTVLFFDEANTTEAIGLIREIMCSRTMNGRPLENADCLRLVATCNPYRRHSDDMVKKLEEAGLGYHTSAGESKDKLGRIPMRRLVYRVQPLPHSMIPLVWDFGQLSDDDELLYIKQIVNSFIDEGRNGRFDLKSEILSTQKSFKECISAVLTVSQQFMRLQKDECSFVSLRNIERVLKVMDWFYQQRQLLFRKVDEKFATSSYSSPNDITRCIVSALAVCYNSCLQNDNYRERYRQTIGQYLTQSPCQIQSPVHDNIFWEIQFCQEVFLDELQLGPNIAKNNALRENVFMMVVCIELRIPLFLVGKPGSSKSLARSIVTDAMQGNASRSKLFRKLKDTSMLSFQCSPLSTPEGIISTFRQCANLQQNRDATQFASVVILEEVGLAEDSPSMPLKTLHPLLEEGARDDKGNLQKVGFIGISNWALDPAKMNRGILVQRCVPDGNELFESALGICSTDISIRKYIEELLESLSLGYKQLVRKMYGVKEFFGLRDFYSLIKMVYDFAAKHNGTITMNQLVHAIKRNFSGLETTDAITLLTDGVMLPDEQEGVPVLDNSDVGLIKASLKGDYLELSSGEDCPSRYLLLLTENNAALTILDQHLLDLNDTKVIYGSSFPRDLEYTQICRNINRIKVYMATGKTVVLINTDNLYESLYDVLNQYYENLGNSQFVSLGLGTHRVKCKVHKEFRLILVAEKEHVYKRFPIPLINRLEKHFLAMSTILSDQQKQSVQQLELWMERFACPIQNRGRGMKVGDAFIGYYKDAASAVVLDLMGKTDTENQDTQKAKEILLRCAAPEAVLKQSKNSQMEWTIQAYFIQQKHSSLQEFLQSQLSQREKPIFAQVLTNSKLLSMADAKEIYNLLGFETQNTMVIGLQKFDTEQEFSKEISGFFKRELHKDRLLIIQCIAGDQYAELIACSRHLIVNEYEQVMDQQGTTLEQIGRIHVVFVIQLPRKAGGCFNGFQGGRWLTIFIDELLPDRSDCPPWIVLHNVRLSSAFENGLLADDPSKGFTRRFTSNLIGKCVHAAGNCVVDTKAPDEEKLRRVKQLMNLLDNLRIEDAALAFEGVFIKRIIVLMKEREESSMNPANWLMRDAADREKVTNAGTLRKSLQMCLESKVTPLLAGLLAFLSSNNNLQIPTEASNSWVRHLWLAMFNDPEITTYKYEEIRTAYNGTELTQMNVTHYWQYPFDTKFPFSHFVKEHLEYLMHTCKNVEDPATTMSNAFETSRLGKLLAAVIPANCTEAIQMFLYDFVRHVYNPINYVTGAKELKVVSDAIIAIAGLSKNIFYVSSFCDLYQAYVKLRLPIQNFRMLLEVDRVQIKNLLDHWTDNSNMRLDLQALHLIIKYLKSIKDELRQDVHAWMGRFKKYHAVIEKALAYIESDTAISSHERFTQIKSDWAILQTVYLFLESVVSSSKEATRIFKSTPGLLLKELTAIDGPLDFKRDRLIKAITTFIAKCTSEIESQQLGNDGEICLQRALTLFFMQLVSQHCFRGQILPEKHVIDRLMSYITTTPGTGRSMFSSKGLKPTPVVRFFLLQLLLQYRSEEVHAYLQSFFKEKLGTRNLEQKIQILRIAVHCFEDSIETRFLTVENPDVHICQTILEARNGLFLRDIVRQMSAIAKARYSLCVLADWLYQRRHESHFNEPEFQEAKRLCLNGAGCTWPRLFFVKVIGRKYGMNVLKSLLKKPNLDWILPEGFSILQVDDIRDDRFVIYGQDYRQIREFIMDRIVDGNLQKQLADVVKTPFHNTNTSRSTLLILSACRLNILCYVHNTIPPQKLQVIENMIKQCDVPSSTKELITSILNNTSISDLLRTSAALPDSDRHLSLVEIVVHFKAVFLTNDVKPVLRLFNIFMLQPGLLRDTYLPTMPEDVTDQVRNALKGVTMWRCPRGHPYMIGECGQPMEQAKCHCGALIGGQDHHNVRGNVKDRGQARDETKTGHILGRANNRPKTNEPERSLSPAKVTIIRMFMHIAMFIGADTQPQDICQLLNFNISRRDVGKEMWSHMALDLSILTNTLQVSLDDCCLFIHRLLMNMASALPSAGSRHSKYTKLNKHERSQWENEIDNLFLKPAFLDKDRLTARDNAVLARDKQDAGSILRNIVFETSSQSNDVDINHFYDSPVLWRYRKSISLQHFKDAVYSAEKTTLAIRFLKSFLEMENQLKWIRFIPSIEKLHIFLSQKCYAKLDRMEAKNMTIKEFLQTIKGQEMEEIEILMHSYFEVWNALRYDIKLMEFPETSGIPDAYLELPLSDQSSLNFLLPAVRGEGMCALGLMAYLCRIHNDFIEEYATLTRTPCTVSVNLKDVTHAHVIGFETDKDLLPIILANCNYAFHEEHYSVDFSYDFDSVSRQMEQRFLHGKPRILFEPELIVFITELTNTLRFQQLEDRVPQENLSQGIKQQIQKGSQDLADVVDLLATLDVAIGFIISIRPDKDTVIGDFIWETLDKPFQLTGQCNDKCQLKHVKSLWTFLAQLKAQILTLNGHDPFDSVDPKYKEPLSAEQVQNLYSALRQANMGVFVSELYECIILQITIKQNENDDDYVDNSRFPLHEILGEYTEAEIPIVDEGVFPQDITAAQCIETWCEAFKHSLRYEN